MYSACKHLSSSLSLNTIILSYRVHKEVENPLYTYSSQQATSPAASATEPHYTEQPHTGLSSEPIYTNSDKDNIYSLATSSDVNCSDTNKGEANYEYCVPSSSQK